VQTGYALSAANALLQVVEVALPKQKKAQAVSEFKHSVIAYKRRARVQENSGLPHIPQDVLVHIFTFLDMRSLVAAGLVCWSWNSAANDNNLWKINYSLFFGLCHLSCNSIPVSGLQKSCELVQSSIDSESIDPNFRWKESFHSTYAECASWQFASNRALCGHCRSVIWLSNLTCAAPHHCRRKGRDEVKLRPLLPDTVSCLTTMWFVPSRLAHCTYITDLSNSNTVSCSLFESAIQFYPRNIITCLPFYWGCIQYTLNLA